MFYIKLHFNKLEEKTQLTSLKINTENDEDFRKNNCTFKIFVL